MKFSDLSNLVFGLAFPRRFSPSLLPLKTHQLKHALTEIQRHVPRFQEANVDIVDGSFDIMVSGASVFDAPDGVIKQVVVGNSGCRSIPADLCHHLHVQKLQASFANAYDCGDPDLPPAYPTSKVYFARDGQDLMVYPWVPAGWLIGIRWKGVKRDWLADTEIWWASTDRVTECLRRYLIAYDKEGCDGFGDLLTMFRDELAMVKAENFHIDNPTQYDPYSVDILSNTQINTHVDTSSAAT